MVRRTIPIGALGCLLGARLGTCNEGGLVPAMHPIQQLHPAYSRSGGECALRLRIAAESCIGDVRIFGGVWYEILHTSGGLPKRHLLAV